MESHIHQSIESGDPKGVEAELQARPDLVHARDDLGNTPLHLACWGKHPTIIGVILAYQPDINARGMNGRTALHWAVHEGDALSLPIVRTLLSNGADASVKDDSGFTPVDHAKSEMFDHLGEVLKAFKEAELDTKN